MNITNKHFKVLKRIEDREKIYIQLMDGKFSDDWIFAAYLGANKLGMNVIYFEDQLEVPKGQFIIGDIDTTLAYFDRTGVKYPLPLNIPNELFSSARREIFEVPLKDIIERPAFYKFPCFIKPVDKLKGFTAGVLRKGTITNLRLMFSDVEDKNQLALISEVIEMESEYRCFIQKGKLIGIKHYQGSFELFPDIDIIKKMIKSYKSSPIAYTLDVAITNKNETVLVECNDGWAVGNYGLDGELYLRFLRDRWNELTK